MAPNPRRKKKKADGQKKQMLGMKWMCLRERAKMREEAVCVFTLRIETSEAFELWIN